MRTDAPANITDNYLKASKKPRTFLYIPDLDRCMGTEANTIDSLSFENRLEVAGTITWDAPLLGGMGSISNASVRNHEIGRAVTFSESVEIEPLFEAGHGAGRVSRIGVVGETYEDIRGAASGDFSTTSIIVGRWYYLLGGADSWGISRAVMQFTIPAMTSLEDGYVELEGLGDNSDTDDYIYLLEGTWTAWNSGGLFDDFSGHQSGLTAYDGTVLNESWHTAQFSTSSTNKIRLNIHGRDLVKAAAGGTIRLVLISKKDYDGNSEPTGDEYVKFKAGSAVLKLRYNTEDLKNKEARIYKAYDPVPSSLSDMFLRWTGVIHDYSLTDSSSIYELRQDNDHQNKLLPENVITSDTFADVPDNNLGEPYPLVVGDASPVSTGLHRLGIGLEKTGGVIDPTSGLHSYFPCPIVKRGDNDYNELMEILVSTRDILDAITAYPAVWVSGIKAFGRLWAMISSDLGSTYQYVTAYPRKRYSGNCTGAGAAVEEDFLGVAVSVIPSSVYDSSGVTDPEDAYSESGSGSVEFDSGSDYSIYGFSSVGQGGTIDKVELVFELTAGAGAYALGLYLYTKPTALDVSGTDGTTLYSDPNQQFISAAAAFQTDSVSAGDMLIIEDETNRGRYRIQSVDSETQLTLVNEILTNDINQSFKIVSAPSDLLATNTQMIGDGQRVLDITSYADWDVENLLVKFSPTDNQTFTLSNLQLRIFMTPDENLTTVYFDKQGLKDDVSGTITGSAGALLENPSHVIEGIARQEMEYDASYIDTAAFDASATLLADWEFAFQTDKQTAAMDLFKSLGLQSKSLIGFDERNRLTMLTHDSDRAFPNASSTTPWVPGELDIFDEDAAPSNGLFTRHPIIPLSLEHKVLREVKNDFKLNYNYNHSLGKYEGLLYIDHGDGVRASVNTNINSAYLENDMTLTGLGGLQDKTAGCYNAVGTTNEIEINCPSIIDEETATRCLQFYVEILTKLRGLVEFQTYDNAILHERWDYINIRHWRLLTYMDQARMEIQKWRILFIQDNLDDNQILIRAIEE